MAKKQRELTGSEQIALLQNLSQEAAAFLVGTTSRSLRDRGGAVPRNTDGTYNGQTLVAWSRSRQPRPELEDSDMEQMLRAAGEFTYDRAESVTVMLHDYLRALREQHGDGGAAAFVDVLVETLAPTANTERRHCRPDRATWMAQAEREFDAAVAAYETGGFTMAVVCQQCGRLRNGRRWIRTEPARGHETAKGICPDCDKGSHVSKKVRQS